MIRRIAIAIAVVVFGAVAHAEDYNLYFGGTHSHTSFSDGVQLVDQAWDVARNQGHVDFWFVTEHYQRFSAPGDLPSGEKVNRWKYENEVSRKVSEDGKFLSLVGWEWSDGGQGHMNVLFDPVTPPDFLMTGAFDRFISFWLKKHPRAITGMNHPFWSADVGLANFSNFKYLPEIASRTVYIEVSQPEDIPFYFVALDRGWRVAPLAAQDNHGPTWGLQPELAAVYAKSLTFDGLREAFIARRFYATTDRTLKLNFEGNGQPMGSQLIADSVNFKVNVSREGDPPAFVRIITNGGVIQKNWKPAPGEFIKDFNITVDSGEVRWYVVYAAMPDGKYSISAPIWVKKQ